MKLILVSSLVLMSVATVLADFKPEYIRAILETAQRNALQGDEPAQPEKIETRGASLSCQTLETGTPTSVHALRPQNIEVIGAIGDSLTAANGAKANSVLFLISEYRGVSWSIGCEAGLDQVVTFATILKYFNPKLTGCSTDTSKQNDTAAQNNFAHPGDTSFDMPSQARMLVAKLLKTPDINNKWKVINFFIGGNDLCDACKDAKQTPENFLQNIQDTLDYFRDNLQRVIVNLVLTLDVTGINILTGITCRNMQSSFCSCGLSDPFYNEIQRLKDRYQKDVRKLIREDARYDNSDLFTVVAHDFMTEMTPPLDSKGKPDYSYFAPDCFHFSQKGHEAAAIELWNSFLTPNNQKAKKWTIGSSIKCPTITDPYIPTNKNSKSLRSLLLKN